MRRGASGRSARWSNISPHVPDEISQSQITIGISISRNTERAEATVALAITVQPDLKMCSREAQSSSLGLTDSTVLNAVSSPGGFLMLPHPLVCDRLSATFPPIGITSSA